MVKETSCACCAAGTVDSGAAAFVCGSSAGWVPVVDEPGAAVLAVFVCVALGKNIDWRPWSRCQLSNSMTADMKKMTHRTVRLISMRCLSVDGTARQRFLGVGGGTRSMPPAENG
ncbi:exported hypothetical protein [Paraburkholderia piptadeniae]|uniref:Uncharacterized protein n=1 Tax=Paraburkholderia piptadeniae TaxID=1701573 RepID=A0A1N7RJP5_9BURK|nr:exported hypothetical protein [Paraburkholderia piptadeniae]